MDKNVAAVSMRGVTKTFGGNVIANDNVSLDIYRGEIAALLGENGSGKTTLMNMLAGIYYPDSGKIFMSRKNGNFQKNIEGLHEFIYGKYYPANNP